MTISLPTPDQEAAQHSARLAELIRSDIIAQGGWIPFSRFMELALYAPGLGYYTAGARKFGKAGDFITAPELSPLFGRTLARQAAEIMASSTPDILELGAGSGKLALDMLVELEQMDALPQSYSILEVSADLRERQRSLLQKELPHLAGRIQWLDALPEKINGAVIANEVLDALPVHLVHWHAMEESADLHRYSGDVGTDSDLPGHPRTITELGVTIEGESFVWQEREPVNDALHTLARNFHEPDDYLSEISLATRGLVTSLSERLDKGAMLFIDYGFGAREYYHPQRSHGTLMCHYRHHAHDDPFHLPGLQDITAHVDFTAVAEAAIDAGANLLGYTTQAHFLINSGIMDFLAESDPEKPGEHLPLAAQFQKLTSPSEMGELFKVIAFGKALDTRLSGFLRGDLSRHL